MGTKSGPIIAKEILDELNQLISDIDMDPTLHGQEIAIDLREICEKVKLLL
ncbi:MAG: hypothetical protein AABY22_18490 [Nanoarchaeota archaeon]